MAGVDGAPQTKGSRAWLGRLIALVVLASAIGLAVWTIYVLDRRPRTHDAHLFAYSSGIAPEVSGQIVALHVTNNQRVKKDQPLVDIDSEPFELRVRQARAQVAALKAQISLTGRQVTSQKSGADAAATQINQARAQHELAQDTLRRLEPLLGKGYVTTQQIDEARTNERNTATALTVATQHATQARQAVGDTETLIAQLAGAEATLALAERDLRLVTVRAPFDGTVVGLQIANGAYAVTGHTLFTMIKDDAWYAIADFRETELPQIAVGDSATVWVMGADDRPIRGHVESIGAGVQPDDRDGPGLPQVGRTLTWVVVAQRFPVWVRLDDPPPQLTRIGATISVRVQHGEHSSTR
jgi:multidrug efflux system membrane fusion protein